MSRLTKVEREIVKRMNSIEALLKKFGLRLSGYDPGITALDSHGRIHNFGYQEWEWLEPILRGAAERQQVTRLEKGGEEKENV